VNRKAEIEILKNQLTAQSSALQNSYNRIQIITPEKFQKIERLNQARLKFNQEQIKLKNEENQALTAEQRRQQAD